MSFVLSGGKATRVQPSSYAVVQEAISDVARQLEDLRYDNLSTTPFEISGDERRRDLQKARRLRRKNPLAKQGAQLLRHYTLGQGITVRAANKAKVAKVIDEFWDDPVNQQVFTGHQAMGEWLDGLWTDGERFLVLLPDEEAGSVQLSDIRPEYVDAVIPDPKNRAVPAWYKVQKRDSKYDWKNGTTLTEATAEFEYYRDWRYAGDYAPPKKLQGVGLVLHTLINRQGMRGESDLGASMDWVNAHRSFMEDRATLNRAAATIAWAKKRKGGAADVAAQVEALRSSVVANANRFESNPPPAAGSTLIENEASDTRWMDTDTGGQAADYDERKFRMMVGSGIGVPNHYFGDEADANLASATSMELPLLKMYEDWQSKLGAVVGFLCEFVLTVANGAGRIGERDDSRKYAERVTTPQQVLAKMEPGAPPAMPSSLGEATTENPSMEVTKTAGQPPTMQLALQPRVEPQAVADLEDDSTGAVDWTVDVDYAPIVQKDIKTYIDAMKVLYELLPGQNIESQKLVVEMVLTALGEGQDLDGMMERLFPVDMVPVEQTMKLANLAKAMNPPPPPEFGPGGPKPKQLSAGFKESTRQAVSNLAEYRIRRLMEAADAAGVLPDDADPVAAVATGS